MSSARSSPDKAAIYKMVAVERLALCDVLDELEPEEWQTRSLCPDWTVRDVVAHLTLATEETLGGMIIAMVKARGSFDRMNTNAAIERSQQFDPQELIQRLRGSANSTPRNPMSTPADQLVDILVHSQDITRPLERTGAMNAAHVLAVLDHAVESHWYGGKKRFSGVHLVATDGDWTAGNGTLEVSGACGDLLLLAAGRASALEHLSGPGVQALVSAQSR